MLIDVLFLFIYDNCWTTFPQYLRAMTLCFIVNWSCRGLDCASKVSVLGGFHLVLGLLTCQVDANTPGSGHVKL